MKLFSVLSYITTTSNIIDLRSVLENGKQKNKHDLRIFRWKQNNQFPITLKKNVLQKMLARIWLPDGKAQNTIQRVNHSRH